MEDGRSQAANIDAHVEDGESAAAPGVVLAVELAEQGGDVGLEETIADRQDAQRQKHDRMRLELQ